MEGGCSSSLFAPPKMEGDGGWLLFGTGGGISLTLLSSCVLGVKVVSLDAVEGRRGGLEWVGEVEGEVGVEGEDHVAVGGVVEVFVHACVDIFAEDGAIDVEVAVGHVF